MSKSLHWSSRDDKLNFSCNKINFFVKPAWPLRLMRGLVTTKRPCFQAFCKLSRNLNTKHWGRWSSCRKLEESYDLISTGSIDLKLSMTIGIQRGRQLFRQLFINGRCTILSVNEWKYQQNVRMRVRLSLIWLHCLRFLFIDRLFS